MGTAAVRVLRPSDAAATTDVLVRGFEQEPAFTALIPDVHTRRIVLRMTIRNSLHDAIRRGTAHAALLDDQTGAAAVWVPPGVGSLSISGSVRAAGRAVGVLVAVAPALPGIVSTLRTDVRGLVTMVRRHRKAVRRASRSNAWNLALIASDPDHRGKGLARALLDRQLQRCDEDRVGVWLDTSEPDNVGLNERFGFETVAHIEGPAWLTGVWVMRREPTIA